MPPDGARRAHAGWEDPATSAIASARASRFHKRALTAIPYKAHFGDGCLHADLLEADGQRATCDFTGRGDQTVAATFGLRAELAGTVGRKGTQPVAARAASILHSELALSTHHL